MKEVMQSTASASASATPGFLLERPVSTLQLQEVTREQHFCRMFPHRLDAERLFGFKVVWHWWSPYHHISIGACNIYLVYDYITDYYSRYCIRYSQIVIYRDWKNDFTQSRSAYSRQPLSQTHNDSGLGSLGTLKSQIAVFKMGIFIILNTYDLSHLIVIYHDIKMCISHPNTMIYQSCSLWKYEHVEDLDVFGATNQLLSAGPPW